MEYIGDSARTFRERLKWHLRAPFPTCDHANISGHNTRSNNLSIVVRESHNIARTIKEAVILLASNIITTI